MAGPGHRHRTTFGDRLKKARLEVGVRQEDLTAIAGIHPMCVSKWEHGRSRPRGFSIEEVEQAIVELVP